MKRTVRWWYATLVAALLYGLVGSSWLRPASEPAKVLAVGDQLTDARLFEMSGADAGDQRSTRIGELVGKQRCAVLLFFHSECSFCQALVPDWRNVSQMTDPSGLSLPVLWIGTSLKDKGARRFITHDSLATTWYSLESGAIADAMGVVGTPTAIVIDSGRQILGMVRPLPQQKSPFPQSCSVS